MPKARPSSEEEGVRRLPRGRHALPPATVLEDQRRRLIAAMPAVAAERGYAAMSVADVVRAAGVSRNAFYANFANKQECFAAAVEAGHERLFGILSENCDWQVSLENRLEARLGAALGLLAAEPDLARLIFVEAFSAGREEALRQQVWLRRYGELLRAAARGEGPCDEEEMIVVGGLTTRIAAALLSDNARGLRQITPDFVAFLLAIYGREPGAAGKAAPAGTQVRPTLSSEASSGARPRPRSAD